MDKIAATASFLSTFLKKKVNAELSWIATVSTHIIVVIIFPILISLQSYAAELPKVKPTPQEVVFKNSRQINIDKEWIIVYDAISPPPANYPSGTNPYFFCAQKLQIALKKIGVQISIQTMKQRTKREKTFFIGNPLHNSYFRTVCKSNNIDFSVFPYKNDDPRYKEAYVIDLTMTDASQSVIIAAPDAAGAYFGVKTLSQLVATAGRYVECMRIVDYPDLQWRGAYLNFKDISFGKKEIKPCIDQTCINAMIDEVEQYSNAKLNTLIFMSLYFHVMDKKTNSLLQQLFTQCRKRFINPVPTLYSRPGRFPVTRKECEVPSVSFSDIEGVWIQNELFYFNKDGYAEAVLPVHGWLKNGSFEEDKDQDGIPDGWSINGSLGVNGWQRSTKNVLNDSRDQIHSGKYAMTLKTGHSVVDTIKRTAGLADNVLKTIVSTIPGSYYELTFWARHNASSGNFLKVEVKQYDKNDHIITSVPPFTEKFHLSKKWSPEHLSIFTHSDCKKIMLGFKKRSRGNPTGQILIDDIKMIRMNGALLNVLRTNQTDVVIKDEKNQKSYTEPSDYRINEVLFRDDVTRSHKTSSSGKPVIWNFNGNSVSSRGAISGIKIKLSPDSGIKKQDVVSISYDCIPLYPEYSRYCLSSQGTYEIYHNSLKNIVQLAPDHININMDEYRGGYNRDSRCLKRNKNNGALFANFVNNLNDLLHQAGDVEVLPGYSLPGLGKPDIRLMIWDDMVNYWHNGGGKRGHLYQVQYGGIPGSAYLALDGTPLKRDIWSSKNMKLENPISKDVILASWWYGKDTRDKMKNSPSFYTKQGYDFFVCPWDTLSNIQQWAAAAAESKCLGMLCTSWNGRKDGILPAADYAWNLATTTN